MSGIINKVKDALHSDNKTHEQPEGTHGTHNSRAANAADPRIDSDRDHRADPTTGTTGTHTGTTGVGSVGHNPTTGVGSTGHNPTTGVGSVGHTPGTAGPHDSNILNKADPRIDSDRDHRANPTTSAGTHIGGSHPAGGVGSTGAHAGGIGSTGTHPAGGIGSTGTHPAGGIGSTTHSGVGSTGYNDPTGTHGSHGRVGNAVDPRIDSDADHRGAPGAAGTAHVGSGPGPAANTAGPHKSDLLNKADPRVDSDLDGSKTVAGNKTYQQ